MQAHASSERFSLTVDHFYLDSDNNSGSEDDSAVTVTVTASADIGYNAAPCRTRSQ